MAENPGKVVLTPEQIIKLSAWSAVRVPTEHMAALLGISVDTLEHIAKSDDAVRSALNSGRAGASINIRTSLFNRAMGRPAVRDKKGKIIEPAIPPDFQAMKFWCQTQEGFKTHAVLDVRSRDVSNLTDDELKQRTEALRKSFDDDDEDDDGEPG